MASALSPPKGFKVAATGLVQPEPASVATGLGGKVILETTEQFSSIPVDQIVTVCHGSHSKEVPDCAQRIGKVNQDAY